MVVLPITRQAPPVNIDATAGEIEELSNMVMGEINQGNSILPPQAFAGQQ